MILLYPTNSYKTCMWVSAVTDVPIHSAHPRIETESSLVLIDFLRASAPPREKSFS